MFRSRTINTPAPVRSAHFCEADNSAWLGTQGGDIVTCRLLDGAVVIRGEGYADLLAVLPQSDGVGLLVVQRDGVILEAPRASADRAGARVVLDLGRPLAATGWVDGSLYLVEDGPDARLLSVDVIAGTTSTVAEHLAGPSAATATDTDQVAVLTTNGLLLVALRNGDMTVLVDDVTAGPSDSMVALTNGQVLVTSGVDGTVRAVDLAAATVTRHNPLGGEVAALTCWGSLLLAVTPDAVLAIEWGLDEGVLPLEMPLGPAFLNGFLRIEADVAAIGVSAEQLDFLVDEGPQAATVSAGLEPAGPGGRHRARVVAGHRPGEFHLTVKRKDTDQTVARARFRISAYWPRDLDGPPLAVTGPQLMRMWGGGPPGAQRLPGGPLPDLWRVAVVYLDTSDKRTPGGARAATEVEYRRYLMGDANPGTLSVRRFLREVSYVDTPGGPNGPKGTDADFLYDRVFGPLGLAGWGDSFEYFNPKQNDLWAGWGPTEAARKAIPIAFMDWVMDHEDHPAALLREIDAIVFVVQTASEDKFQVGGKDMRAKYIWPQSWSLSEQYSFTEPGQDGVTHTGYLPVPPAIYMPSHLPSMMPNTAPLFAFDRVATLCHELGHTFGCADLYDGGDWDPEIAGRTAGGADIMAGGSGPVPGYSIANRMRFGWVDPAWLEAFDFTANPVGGTVSLQSLETLARTGPRPNRRAGIAVRIENGHNYFVEHRLQRAGQMADQNLNGWFSATRVVIGTDVEARATKSRPDILLLHKDVDGDGAILTTPNQNYIESDTTDKERMFDFRIVYQGVEPGDNDAVRVRVEYEGAHRAQLHIEPARGAENWKSPDIDLAGPFGANKIAVGLEHTITVKVHNLGTFGADNVKLRIAWLPFTTSAGAWTQLPDPPTQNIAAKSMATFTAKWTPPKDLKINDVPVRHFCVMAQVDAYVDPRDPAHNEVTVFDNRAQSNFETADAPSGSPSQRRSTAVVVTNVLARDATHVTMIQQDHEAFRAYVDHAWLHLAPGETRAMELAYESLAGDPIAGNQFERDFESIAREVNTLSVSSLVLPPDDGLSRFPRLRPGVTLSIRAGRRTVIRDVKLDGEDVNGDVTGLRDGAAVPLSSGAVTIVLWLAERDDETFQTSGTVGVDSRFHALCPQPIMHAAADGREVLCEALFLGVPEWSASRSGTVRLR